MVRNYSSSVDDVAAKLRPLLDDDEAKKAVDVLQRDFTDREAIGPRRVAEFVMGAPDDDVQADVASFVSRLLALVGQSS